MSRSSGLVKPSNPGEHDMSSASRQIDYMSVIILLISAASRLRQEQLKS